MKNVIVFFNGKPGKVVTVQQATTSVRQEYPDGEEIHLQIMSAGDMNNSHIIQGPFTQKTLLVITGH